MQAIGGQLPNRVAAKMLLAAAFVDILFLMLLTLMAATALFDVMEQVLHSTQSNASIWGTILNRDAKWAEFFCFVTLFSIYQIVTETILGGRTIGRAVLGLHMCEQDGKLARQTRRMTRGMLKLSSLGLPGLQIKDLPRYDRTSKVVWHSRIAPRAPGSVDTWRLIIESRDKKRKSIVLGKVPGFNSAQAIKIGRNPEWADLVLPDTSKASSKHCVLNLRSGNLHLADVGSTNGTFVSGKRIAKNNWINLKDITEFAAADVRFKIIK